MIRSFRWSTCFGGPCLVPACQQPERGLASRGVRGSHHFKVGEEGGRRWFGLGCHGPRELESLGYLEENKSQWPWGVGVLGDTWEEQK